MMSFSSSAVTICGPSTRASAGLSRDLQLAVDFPTQSRKGESAPGHQQSLSNRETDCCLPGRSVHNDGSVSQCTLRRRLCARFPFHL